MNGSFLQENCNKEGFNINTEDYRLQHLKVQIGMIANNENNCKSGESCFGFGTSIRGCDGEINTTCGNIGICGYSGNKNTTAFGYIFVQ